MTVEDSDMDNQQIINLKLCLYGGKERIVEREFNIQATIDEVLQVMRGVFKVEPDRETRLWLNNKVHIIKIASNNKIESTSDDSATDTKENNNLSTDFKDSVQAKVNNEPNSSASSIKPPPTPPPIPSNKAANSSSTSQGNNTPAKATNPTPNVITRQAAQSMNMLNPIPLPDITSFASASNTESQLDLNQTLAEANLKCSSSVTLELQNDDGTWPSSRRRDFGLLNSRSPKVAPGLCGLSNMGNTCFMNAALQCLSNTQPITDYILSDKFVDDINTMNPLGMQGEIARTYADLIKVMWSGNHSSFLPREFKCAVSRFAPQFTGFAQQDCQELMAFLLDGLHEDLNRIKNKPYIEVKDNIERRPDEDVAKESWENYKKRNDSIVVDTFHAMLKSTLICPECELVSVTFDPFCYLSLPLPVKREKQVNLTFLSAPAKLDESRIEIALKKLSAEDVKIVRQYGARISSFNGSIEEQAGYRSPLTWPKTCKVQVPRAGPTFELCELVARIINDRREANNHDERVSADNLVVAELANGKIQRIYESNEHYNQISDDIVVVEKKYQYVIPLYIREKRTNSTFDAPKLFFLHVPDLKYPTLYKSIISSFTALTTKSEEEIQNWYKFDVPEIENETIHISMDCDDDIENEANSKPATLIDGDDIAMNGELKNQTNGKNNVVSSTTTAIDSPVASTDSKTMHTITFTKMKDRAFDLGIVNSFGTLTFEFLGPSKDADYSSKLYLAALLARANSEVGWTDQFCDLDADCVAEPFTPNISQKPTLQLKDCITQFTNAERLGADDPWYCPKCKKHQQAIKKFDVWSLPKILIIHLKRFSFSRSWRDKIDTLVEFPVEGLDMSSYLHNPEQKKPDNPMVYDLIGVANHFGGLGGGHYTAYAKNAPKDAWYSFDDAMVTQTNPNSIVTRSAYVLFYQLQEKK